MNKKLLSVFLAAAIVLQFIFPVYGIVSTVSKKHDVEENGGIFRVSLPYLQFYDGICRYDMPICASSEEMFYASVSTGEDGIAVFDVTTSKPSTPYYVAAENDYAFYEAPKQLVEYGKYKNISCVDFNTGTEPGTVFGPSGTVNTDVGEIIAEVIIYNGNVVTKEFYIDGVPLHDVLSYLNDYI